MDEATAIYTIVLGGGALIAIVAPILKLNTSIVNLTTSIDHMKELDIVRDKRITKHGEEIEHNHEVLIDVKHEIANHETRIQSLEHWKENTK